MKFNWKAILGIVGGLGIAGVSAFALCASKADDYIDSPSEDDLVDFVDSAVEAE